MEWLKLVNVVVITPGHSLSTHNKLRQQRHVKSDKNNTTSNFCPELTIHFTKHFWPPVMNSGEECHHHTAHHYIVEVGNYIVCIMQVNIYNQCAEHNACKTTDGKQKEKHHGIQHGCFHVDGPLVHGCQPVKYFYTGWDSDQECKKREYHTGK